MVDVLIGSGAEAVERDAETADEKSGHGGSSEREYRSLRRNSSVRNSIQRRPSACRGEAARSGTRPPPRYGAAVLDIFANTARFLLSSISIEKPEIVSRPSPRGKPVSLSAEISA